MTAPGLHFAYATAFCSTYFGHDVCSCCACDVQHAQGVPSCLSHLQDCLKVVSDNSGALELSGRLALQDTGHTDALQCEETKGRSALVSTLRYVNGLRKPLQGGQQDVHCVAVIVQSRCDAGVSCHTDSTCAHVSDSCWCQHAWLHAVALTNDQPASKPAQCKLTPSNIQHTAVCQTNPPAAGLGPESHLAPTPARCPSPAA
jgi:hypothetical protein